MRCVSVKMRLKTGNLFLRIESLTTVCAVTSVHVFAVGVQRKRSHAADAEVSRYKEKTVSFPTLVLRCF